MNKWKPNVGDSFFAPRVWNGEPDAICLKWEEYMKDLKLYQNGLVCKTRDEALEIAKKYCSGAKERVDNE